MKAERGTNANSSIVGALFGSFVTNILTYTDLYFNVYGPYRDTLDAFAGRYKVIFNGLKRRNYRAGSYQRAFNNAKFVADAMGWAAYGIQQKAGDNYQFISHNFAGLLNDNMGRSHSIETLDQALMYTNPEGDTEDHLIRYAGFVDNGNGELVSPVRVIQFGHTASSYAVYQNNVLDVSGSRRQNDPFTPKLTIRPVLQLPGELIPQCEACHVIPGLSPNGSWGSDLLP